MTPTQFASWLAAIKAAGLARSNAEAARLLGITREHIQAMLREGTRTRQTDLACAAILNRLEPFGD